ncbi:hypothetical protein BDP27DRAFT_1449367 [Rhodocollybia butyracea]|uniref:Uncharacterized protein n=1 Tax=Rhodocollybia butyracea TaxID=206335 RepID=A0A9P5PS85_9AGAR|nr:hypothetical protein BDP27DRAFT_1449367 [Rhodocollybia butyracea]
MTLRRRCDYNEGSTTKNTKKLTNHPFLRSPPTASFLPALTRYSPLNMSSTQFPSESPDGFMTITRRSPSLPLITSPGKILTAIATSGSVDDSIHSPRSGNRFASLEPIDEQASADPDVSTNKASNPPASVDSDATPPKTSAPASTSLTAPKGKKNRKAIPNHTEAPTTRVTRSHSTSTVDTSKAAEGEAARPADPAGVNTNTATSNRGKAKAKEITPPPAPSSPSPFEDDGSDEVPDHTQSPTPNDDTHNDEHFFSDAARGKHAGPLAPVNGTRSTDEKDEPLASTPRLREIPVTPSNQSTPKPSSARLTEPQLDAPPAKKLHGAGGQVEPTFVPHPEPRPRLTPPPAQHQSRTPIRVEEEVPVIRFPFGTFDGRPSRLPAMMHALPGDFPFITGRNIEVVLDGLDPFQAKAWRETPVDQNPLIATIADCKNLQQPQREAIIKRFVAGLFNISTSDLDLSSPICLRKPDGTPASSPISHLIRGIDSDLSAYHLSTTGQFTIAAGGQAVHISKLFSPIDGFLGVIANLTFKDDDSGTAECTNFIRNAIYYDNTIRNLVLTNIPEQATMTIDDFGQEIRLSPQQLFTSWTLTIVVHSLRMGAAAIPKSSDAMDMDDAEEELFTQQWLLYCQPICDSVAVHQALMKQIAKLNPIHPFRGQAQFSAAAFKPCYICFGNSHPVGLCPFPRLEGWQGPTVGTNKSKAPGTSGNSGRGGGRGGPRGRRGGRGSNRGNRR